METTGLLAASLQRQEGRPSRSSEPTAFEAAAPRGGSRYRDQCCCTAAGWRQRVKLMEQAKHSRRGP